MHLNLTCKLILTVKRVAQMVLRSASQDFPFCCKSHGLLDFSLPPAVPHSCPVATLQINIGLEM